MKIKKKKGITFSIYLSSVSKSVIRAMNPELGQFYCWAQKNIIWHYKHKSRGQTKSKYVEHDYDEKKLKKHLGTKSTDYITRAMS